MTPFVDFFATSVPFCSTYQQHYLVTLKRTHIVSGVSIAFHFVNAPRLLHLFEKAKKSQYDFAFPYFIGGQFFISFQ